MITPATEILNQKGTPMFNSDLLANRPAAGIAGRIFISTDTKEFYRDTGSTWELIGGPGSGTVTGTGTATQVAFWTGSSAIGGNNDLWWDNVNSRLGIGNNNPATNLDIHGNNATIQIDGRSTSSAYIQFLTQGSAKWRIGNISTGNYFQIFDNSSSIERVKLENNGSLTLLGYYNAIRTETATAGNGFYGLYSWDVMTIPASTNFTNIGNSFGSIVGRNNMTYQGAATFGNANVPTAILGTNIFDFSSGSGTITINQGTGIRSFSALTAFNQVNSATTGTISHLSSIQVLAPFSQAGTMIVTNYYGLLLNASDERTAFSITNKWGIYQEGSNDINYLAGNTLLGSNTNTGEKLQITGVTRFNGNITSNNTFIDLGTASKQMFLYSDTGSGYAINLAGNNVTGSSTSPLGRLFCSNVISGVSTQLGLLGYYTDGANDASQLILWSKPSGGSMSQRINLRSNGNFLIGTTIDTGWRLETSGKTKSNGNTCFTGTVSIASSSSATIYTIPNNVGGAGIYHVYVAATAGSEIYTASAIITSTSFNNQATILNIYDGANVTLTLLGLNILIVNDGFSTITWTYTIHFIPLTNS